jgi:hypothetical protein
MDLKYACSQIGSETLGVLLVEDETTLERHHHLLIPERVALCTTTCRNERQCVHQTCSASDSLVASYTKEQVEVVDR